LLPLAVVNPFAPALTFPTSRIRSRRDHEKYLTLIDAITLLHQQQRSVKTLPDGQRCIETTLDDIALANQLGVEIFNHSLDELPPQTRLLLDFIRDWMKKRPPNGPQTFCRREIREACGWSLTQVRIHLARLVELESLAVRPGHRGGAFVYELIVDAFETKGINQLGLIDVTELKQTFDAGVAVNGKKSSPLKIQAPVCIKPSPDGVTAKHMRTPGNKTYRNRIFQS
jgi:hypothetical protein